VGFLHRSGYFKKMKITEIKPFELVKWVCITGADEWIGTAICFILQEGDKENLLHAHPEAKDQIQQKMNGGKATILTFHRITGRNIPRCLQNATIPGDNS
jgi:hypothetical protein